MQVIFPNNWAVSKMCKCNIYQNMAEKLCLFLFFLQEKVKSSISKLKDLHLSSNSEAVKEATEVWKVAYNYSNNNNNNIKLLALNFLNNFNNAFNFD